MTPSALEDRGFAAVASVLSGVRPFAGQTTATSVPASARLRRNSISFTHQIEIS